MSATLLRAEKGYNVLKMNTTLSKVVKRYTGWLLAENDNNLYKR